MVGWNKIKKKKEELFDSKDPTFFFSSGAIEECDFVFFGPSTLFCFFFLDLIFNFISLHPSGRKTSHNYWRRCCPLVEWNKHRTRWKLLIHGTIFIPPYKAFPNGLIMAMEEWHRWVPPCFMGVVDFKVGTQSYCSVLYFAAFYSKSACSRSTHRCLLAQGWFRALLTSQWTANVI